VIVSGNDGWGEDKVPAGLSNVVAISSGNQFVVALKADGGVVAWGNNDFGQTNVPSNATNIIAVSAAGIHALALARDGGLITWGSRGYGPIANPPALSNVVAIAAGDDYDLALTDVTSPVTATVGPHCDSAFFDQTGLMIQRVRLFNRNALDIPASRVVVQGLPPDFTVFNASGTNSAGLPYVQYNFSLPPGGSADLAIEYLTPGFTMPNITLNGQSADPVPEINPMGTVQSISGEFELYNGQFAFDFPSLPNQTYYIQYTSDLIKWKAAFPPLIGSGSGIRWADDGPPKTDSDSTSQTNRFYRVLQAQ
jgi:hypothetical protein